MKNLVKNSEGYWCVTENKLTCGSVLSVFIKGIGWLEGRVEYADSMGGYFFFM